MTTIAHMHNPNGSEWNAEIHATKAEVLAARETLLEVHAQMHATRHGQSMPEGGWPRGWRGCSPQVCARWIIMNHAEMFAPAIVAELHRAEKAGCHPVMQFLYAVVLPRRMRMKGLKGVFFETVSEASQRTITIRVNWPNVGFAALVLCVAVDVAYFASFLL